MAIQDHNLNMTEKQYRDLDIPSYSMLSSISSQGVDVIHGEKVNLNLKFGSLVDMMCFEPERVASNFVKEEAGTVPTGNIKKICDYVLSMPEKTRKDTIASTIGISRKQTKKTVHNFKKGFLLARDHFNVFQRLSEVNYMADIEDRGQKYFLKKLESKGKTMIKEEMWRDAVVATNTLNTHPVSRKYFGKAKNVDIIYQFKFRQNVLGYETKGMLDCLIVNHDAKVIIPVDLKTGEVPAKDFQKSFLNYKYYLQASLYRQALVAITKEDMDLEDYEVKAFEFVYISKCNLGKPMKFFVNEAMELAAIRGFEDRHGNRHEGLKQLLEDYYYAKNNNSMYTEEEDNSGCSIELDGNVIAEHLFKEESFFDTGIDNEEHEII